MKSDKTHLNTFFHEKFIAYISSYLALVQLSHPGHQFSFVIIAVLSGILFKRKWDFSFPGKFIHPQLSLWLHLTVWTINCTASVNDGLCVCVTQ